MVATGPANGAYGIRPGYLVYLDPKGDSPLVPGDPTAVTDIGGISTFTGVASGAYTVRVVTYPAAALFSSAGGACHPG